MTLLNRVYDHGSLTHADYRTLLLLTNPFAPHVSEELWEIMQYGGTVTDQAWPQYEEEKCREKMVELAVQINGKVRSRIVVNAKAAASEVLEMAKADEAAARHLEGKNIVKELYVPGRLVNFVVK